jgi:hypothetical protein
VRFGSYTGDFQTALVQACNRLVDTINVIERDRSNAPPAKREARSAPSAPAEPEELTRLAAMGVNPREQAIAMLRAWPALGARARKVLVDLAKTLADF